MNCWGGFTLSNYACWKITILVYYYSSAIWMSLLLVSALYILCYDVFTVIFLSFLSRLTVAGSVMRKKFTPYGMQSPALVDRRFC
jgi:hypothetical protein